MRAGRLREEPVAMKLRSGGKVAMIQQQLDCNVISGAAVGRGAVAGGLWAILWPPPRAVRKRCCQLLSSSWTSTHAQAAQPPPPPLPVDWRTRAARDEQLDGILRNVEEVLTRSWHGWWEKAPRWRPKQRMFRPHSICSSSGS